MRPDDQKPAEQPVDLRDLPPRDAADASKDADRVKGGADVVSPRDAASGLPTGKRMP
ncbi:MAG: hypothetical protein ACREPM_25785 [Gemmatimonadaceae bacterium]